MAWLLNAAYLSLIAAAFPWLLYQRLRHGKYREGWPAKLWGDVPPRDGDRRCLWLHAVSVGEVNLLQTLLTRWETQHPDGDVVISTTTQAGFQLAQKKYAPRTVIYAPLDFSWAVRRAMKRIRPDLLVLTELELWPNLVCAAKMHGASVAVVNGRLSEKSFHGYRRAGWLMRRVLPQIDLIAVQNDEYAGRFRDLGARPESVHVTGSVKFDGARTNRDADEVRRLAELAGIKQGDVVFLAGSTQAPEESLAIAAFQRLGAEFPNLRLIVVPRHPERFDEVADLLDGSGLSWQRRSLLRGPLAPRAESPQKSLDVSTDGEMESPTAAPRLAERDDHHARILLVDAVGELASWWGTATIAFVGGSLTDRGGQNMIEPAAYGCAVSFGPNTWNFRDVATMLVENHAAVVVHNGDELEAFARRCLNDPQYAAALGGRAQQLVLQQQGAADRTIDLLSRLLSGGRSAQRPHFAIGRGVGVATDNAPRP